MTDVLLIDRDAHVESWTLNRPSVRNALDPELVEALRHAVAEAEANGTRVVILRGAGLGFCAGADLSYLLDCARRGISPRPHLQSIGELTQALESSPIIFIAAIHGFAVAGGLEIALSCDLAVSAAGARVGDGHVKNDLVPGGGASVRLPMKIGRGSATSWLALSGELVRAELLPPGWLHAVVEGDELHSKAKAMAAVLVARPAAAQRRYKTLLAPNPHAVSQALITELDVFEEHWASSDVATQLAIFLGGDGERRQTDIDGTSPGQIDSGESADSGESKEHVRA